MVTVSLRMDEKMKKDLDQMCDQMGINITTFFTMYAKKALRERRIPFEIDAPLDPFYSKNNQKQLKKSEKQFKDGLVITKTMDELENMEIE